MRLQSAPGNGNSRPKRRSQNEAAGHGLRGARWLRGVARAPDADGSRAPAEYGMKTPATQFLLAAFASFGVGFLTARAIRSDSSPSASAPVSHTAPPRPGNLATPFAASTKPSAKEQVEAVAVLIGKPASMERDRDLYLAVQQMSAQDLVASADAMLAL